MYVHIVLILIYQNWFNNQFSKYSIKSAKHLIPCCTFQQKAHMKGRNTDQIYLPVGLSKLQIRSKYIE